MDEGWTEGEPSDREEGKGTRKVAVEGVEWVAGRGCRRGTNGGGGGREGWPMVADAGGKRRERERERERRKGGTGGRLAGNASVRRHTKYRRPRDAGRQYTTPN